MAIVTEAMALRFWADGDAVGRLVRRFDDDPPWLVAGVASDAKVRTLGEASRDVIYLPYSQRFASSLTVLARTSIDLERTAIALLTAGRTLDPDLWVLETETMDRHLAMMRLQQQLSAFVLSTFRLLALALAGVGIRTALGAATDRLVPQLVANGFKLVLAAGVLGLAIALAAVRLLDGLLFEVSVLGPLTFPDVPLALGTAALLAAWLPARRVDPVTVLRIEEIPPPVCSRTRGPPLQTDPRRLPPRIRRRAFLQR